MIILQVSNEVADLLRDIRELQYGHLLDVEIDTTRRPTKNLNLSERQERLVTLISEGVGSFESIKVHEGDPVSAIVDGVTRSGYYYKRNYRF